MPESARARVALAHLHGRSRNPAHALSSCTHDITCHTVFPRQMPRNKYNVTGCAGGDAPNVKLVVPMDDSSLVSELLDTASRRASRLPEFIDHPEPVNFAFLRKDGFDGPYVDVEDTLEDVVEPGDVLFALSQRAATEKRQNACAAPPITPAGMLPPLPAVVAAAPWARRRRGVQFGHRK